MKNFIVSARKYRPSTFASVVGQHHITSTLKNAMERKQLAHAYLFCGPRGVGKTTCARILAKAVNCLNPTVDFEACNACESCRAFDENRSFNIHELDAASNNSVDDIRALTEQVRVPPQIGKYSVYIIDEVHMLSAAAFNAFLKTLEEPPAHAIFILATTEKHKIIPTILSRCQIYDFNRIKAEDSAKYLQYIAETEGVAYDDESLQLIAQKADGGMRDALSMFDKAVSFSGGALFAKSVSEALNVLDYDTYFTLTDVLVNGDYKEALLLFDRVLQKGFDAQIFLHGLHKHFRDLLIAKNKDTLPLLETTGSVAERYGRQSAECSLAFLFNAINLTAGVDSTLKQASNQRLHVELGLLKLANLSQKKNDLTTLPPDKEKTVRTENGGESPQPVFADRYPLPVIEKGKVPPENPPISETTPKQNEPSSRQSLPASSAPMPSNTDSPAENQTHNTPQARPSITGISIQHIVSSAKTTILEKSGEEPDVQTDNGSRTFTPQEIESMKEGIKKFAAQLKESRPRIAVAFEHAGLTSGGTVVVHAGSEILKNEILGSKFDLLKELADNWGIDAVDLDVKVSPPEENPHKLIVKPEDKFRHMATVNKQFLTFCEELGLDVE